MQKYSPGYFCGDVSEVRYYKANTYVRTVLLKYGSKAVLTRPVSTETLFKPVGRISNRSYFGGSCYY